MGGINRKKRDQTLTVRANKRFSVREPEREEGEEVDKLRLRERQRVDRQGVCEADKREGRRK